MQFFDDSLLPETQDPLCIQVAPYAPSFFPRDSDDIPLSYAEQVQKAVDCYNAGATVLHVHVREPDGSGSKNLDRFNEMLDRLRSAVPKMILQVGGSISFAPKNDGEAALWLSDDTRHMLADLNPAPDQVTLAVNTNQMNVMELITEDDCAGTSMGEANYTEAYTEMYYEAGPNFMKEHMKRLTAAGIQTHFMVGCTRDLETVERLVRTGHYMGPLAINWVAIGGGHDGPNPRNLMEFINRLATECDLHRRRANAQRLSVYARWQSQWACMPVSDRKTISGVARVSARLRCSKLKNWCGFRKSCTARLRLVTRPVPSIKSANFMRVPMKHWRKMVGCPIATRISAWQMRAPHR